MVQTQQPDGGAAREPQPAAAIERRKGFLVQLRHEQAAAGAAIHIDGEGEETEQGGDLVAIGVAPAGDGL